MVFRIAIIVSLVLVVGCDVSIPVAAPTPTLMDEPDREAAILAATWQVVFLDITDLSLVDSNGVQKDAGAFRGLPLAAATAFAVSEDELVTNAHVVHGILDVVHAARFPSLIAVQHETGRTVRIGDAWLYPGYDPDAAIQNVVDVAILHTDGTFVDTLPLLSNERVVALAVGDPVTLCGFPGGVTEDNTFDGFLEGLRPRATCGSGELTELRRIDPNASLDPENLNSLRYDIATERGSSGSAIVGSDGSVVGVHAFAFFESGTGGGPRGDKIGELMDLVATDSVSPVDIETVRVVVFCVDEGSVCPEDIGDCNYNPTTGEGSGFDPTCFDCDTDCDGWSDQAEFENGTSPCDPDDIPMFLELATGECTAAVVRGAPSELDVLLEGFAKARKGRSDVTISVWDGASMSPL